MYAIILYDADVKRVNKYLKLLRRYLHHVQNSCFEGTISKSKLDELKTTLAAINIKNKNSIITYTFHNSKYIKRVSTGEKRGIEGNVL